MKIHSMFIVKTHEETMFTSAPVLHPTVSAALCNKFNSFNTMSNGLQADFSFHLIASFKDLHDFIHGIQYI